ncbi:hypothetical protein OJAV_G00039710 [Oryzias javanicus]|uniref:Uncharacterized protein n=1 Tax=Oryzias javanicus TaxID=123683 RepID=A0A437DCF0_ORYJA|nr:hypothetical protein OJAV_G00039710 [Oryzias javanicus]
MDPTVEPLPADSPSHSARAEDAASHQRVACRSQDGSLSARRHRAASRSCIMEAQSDASWELVCCMTTDKD